MARAQKGGSARPLLLTSLLGGIAVLSLMNWHLYSTAVDISPLSPQTRQVDAKEARDHELATPLDDKPQIVFEETLQRPLFHADRKPIERAKEVVEGPAPAALNTGVLADAASAARADADEREAEAARLSDAAARLTSLQGELDELDKAIAAGNAARGGIADYLGRYMSNCLVRVCVPHGIAHDVLSSRRIASTRAAIMRLPIAVPGIMWARWNAPL